MAETLIPDICIIGAGPGGLAVAMGAAALGVSTVLVDHAAMGGESLPTKALIAAAKRAAVAQHSQRFGVKALDIAIDFAAVHQHVEDVVAALAPNATAARLKGLGVRVVEGQARFKDRRTVVVGDEISIRARRFVIATGATPAVPPISGLNEGPYFTSETVFKLKELPPRLIIIGGGTAGIELAQAFRRLGSGVTVLDAAQPLGDHDPEAAEIVLAQLEREGVVIKSAVKIVQVSHIAGSVAVAIETDGRQEMVEGTHLLIAAGRKPVTDGLDLEAGRIKHDASGIAVTGADGINYDTVASTGDAEFLATLRATETISATTDMPVEVSMAAEMVLGFHGQLEYKGTRLAGLWPHQQMKLVEQAGAAIFGPVVNNNSKKSCAWNVARAVTFVKACTADATIPIHPNVGNGVGGVPMFEVSPMDMVSRASAAMIEVGKADGL